MARAKVVDFDYFEFQKLLRRAGDAGHRVERADQARWAEFVRRHGVNEVAATAIARQRLERAVPVILAEGLASDGLYFYSPVEETCLRLVALESGAT